MHFILACASQPLLLMIVANGKNGSPNRIRWQGAANHEPEIIVAQAGAICAGARRTSICDKKPPPLFKRDLTFEEVVAAAGVGIRPKTPRIEERHIVDEVPVDVVVLYQNGATAFIFKKLRQVGELLRGPFAIMARRTSEVGQKLSERSNVDLWGGIRMADWGIDHVT